MPAPFLQHVSVVPGRVPETPTWPFTMPLFRELALDLTRPVTFFVGENGSGKSTLIEGIAEACGLPVSGGGVNERPDAFGPERRSALGPALRPRFRAKPSDRFFFRAELQSHFASLLDRREEDADFGGDPYSRYGGSTLHALSHGEAFLAILTNRLQAGLVLMDEPESALSPQRQLALLARMGEMVDGGKTQFLVATHSPILMTFPGAEILSLDAVPVVPVRLEDTSHYRVTKGILDDRGSFWRHLTAKT